MRIQNDEDIFSSNDIKIIETLSQDPNLFPLLVKSFCPTIYGHELVKAGLLLTILGGSNPNLDPNARPTQKRSNTHFRPDCHLLLLGDPGLGKS